MKYLTQTLLLLGSCKESTERGLPCQTERARVSTAEVASRVSWEEVLPRRLSEKPEWIETEVGCVRECCDSKEESSFPTYPT